MGQFRSNGQTGGRLRLDRGGIMIEVLEYGARLSRCLVPDATGHRADIVPGFDTAEAYAERGGVTGSIVGRYGNRIEGGRIAIGDRVFELSRNDGVHTMHGGAQNFSSRIWRGEYVDDDTIRLRLTSPEGDQGWPGHVEAQVEYRLGSNQTLAIDMSATSDTDTYLNMLFHGYWNLAGQGTGPVLAHWLKLAADHYLPKGGPGVPTGEILSVADTAFDFRRGKRLGQDIARVGRGYGHAFCLSNYRPGRVAPALVLACPSSGRALTLRTDQPSVQVYTANLWSAIEGKGGAVYDAHSAVALETQAYPNAPNTPTFNPRPLRAGETYTNRMRFAFHNVARRDRGAALFS
ncbi:aldose epimerase family protein [Roseicyclus sp. F158]|uniref:Aldose 1-epimerase n=1 Tax=Tropicimonas omnivorans TaxID=3075590 RepID=A0ABU3DHF3_9RHOB|nr:aldose epimerase family protein [Roseicyclus sp. F158]MDT0683155.1 aldose epimerase family protein [Roseicyclus sp. F158]